MGKIELQRELGEMRLASEIGRNGRSVVCETQHQIQRCRKSKIENRQTPPSLLP